MLKKRKVKFKDGTMGSYTPKEVPQLTFFTCENGEKCVGGTIVADKVFPANLNSTELSHGNICTACSLAEKMKKDKDFIISLQKQNKRNEKIAAEKMAHALSFAPDIIPLETKTVNYLAIDYKIDCYSVKGSKHTHIKITSPEGNVLYQSGTDICCKEGREVWNYCFKNADEKGRSLIPQNSI